MVSVGCHIHHGADLENVVLLDDVTVGPDTVLRNCVVDKNVIIPAETHLGDDLERDGALYDVSAGGIVVVSKNAVVDPT